MIKSAVLCNPPTGLYVREDRCQSSVNDFAVRFPRPPMDILNAAAYLEESGVIVTVCDYPMSAGTWEDFRDDIRRLMPDFLLISVTTPTLKQDIKACTLAREINPHIITSAKGAHFRDHDVEVLNSYKDLDLVFRGEDLRSVVDIASGKEMSQICGITYRVEGNTVRNEGCSIIENLDDLPMPALHLIDNSLYVRPDTGKPLAHIDTSHGCPARCIYCLTGKVHGHRIRYKSPKRVVDEIERCIREFNISNFHFKADTFTWNKDWMLEVCNEIIRRGLGIEWFCNSRVDTIDEDRIKLMKKAGCFAIGFGIESGSPEILKHIKKGITLEQCRKAMKLCKKYRIKSYNYFMIGFPWDTEETVNQTIDFAVELDSDFIDIFIAYPFPGTEFESIVNKEGLLTDLDSKRAYSQAGIRTFTLSEEKLLKLRRKGLIRFYTRPRYIARRLAEVRDLRTLRNYFSQGARLLYGLLPGHKG